MSRFLLTIFGLFYLSFSAVASTEEAASLIKQAQDKQLAEHPYWQALLHFKSKESGGSGESEIVSPEFFLAKNGRYDVEAELRATLEAIFFPSADDMDQHAQCRFVARYRWLKKMLAWPKSSSSEMSCLAYERWALKGEIESLSLIFASGYLGNPASFYGHLLLKFNSNRELIATDLMDQSINFGAIVPENESPLIYIYRGIFGGYDAAFSHTQFFRQNHIYVESELRDMWEYELELSKDEVAQIVAHSWELMGQQFVYYFHKENCAYQMAELLRLVVGQPLLRKSLPWALPSSIIDHMTTITHNGQPLIRKVRLIPSRQSRFYAGYDALSLPQKKAIDVLVESDLELQIPHYQQLSTSEKSQLLVTLFDYFEYMIVEEEDDDVYRKSKHKLLMERLSLPMEKTKQARDYPMLAPHYSSLPSLLRVSGLHNSSLGYGIELQARPTYYDTLALDEGRIAHSHITMFDVKFVFLNQQLKLRSLDFVNVETLNLSTTPLPGDGGLAWKVKFGFDSSHLGCVECLAFSLKGGVGKAFSFGSNNVLYGMLEGGLEMPSYNRVIATSLPKVVLIMEPVSGWKIKFSAGRHYRLSDGGDDQNIYQLEGRWGERRGWDVRFSYQEHVAKEVKVGVSLYW